MQNIFVYGTLLSPVILEKLTGKSFKTSEAVLFGYKRYCVKNSDYPAIIQQEGSKTTGLVVENVDDSKLEVLSFYEGVEYEKKLVTVNWNGKSADALTFVWANGSEFLEVEDWDFNRFKKNYLKHYLLDVIPETLESFNKK